MVVQADSELISFHKHNEVTSIFGKITLYRKLKIGEKEPPQQGTVVTKAKEAEIPSGDKKATFARGRASQPAGQEPP